MFDAHRAGNSLPSFLDPETLILLFLVDCGLAAVEEAFVILRAVASSLGLGFGPRLDVEVAYEWPIFVELLRAPFY
jgi:hypothetical protein